MRTVILRLIEIYWIVSKDRTRRACLFSESCSQHVYRIAKYAGPIEGLKALLRRFRQCRPGFQFIAFEDRLCLRTIDGSVIEFSDLSGRLCEPASAILESLSRDPSQGDCENGVSNL